MIKLLSLRWVAVGFALGSYLITPTFVHGQALSTAYDVARMFDRAGLPF